ncbi:MAG: hypothetical protein AB7D57_02240 [Desulfovibrionaceae bacterium]
MKMHVPEVREEGVPVWCVRLLGALRRAVVQLAGGTPDRMGRAVTFQDLADMGLATPEAAERQAGEGR